MKKSSLTFNEILIDLSDRLTACTKIKLAFARWVYKMILWYSEMNMNSQSSDKMCLAASLIDSQVWDLNEITTYYLLYINQIWWLILSLTSKLIIAF